MAKKVMILGDLSNIGGIYDQTSLIKKFKLTRYALEWSAFYNFENFPLSASIDSYISGKVHKSQIEKMKVDRNEPFFRYYPIQFISEHTEPENFKVENIQKSISTLYQYIIKNRKTILYHEKFTQSEANSNLNFFLRHITLNQDMEAASKRMAEIVRNITDESNLTQMINNTHYKYNRKNSYFWH